MIRYAYINNQILELFKKLPKLTFPINISQIIELIPNCKYMSYQRLAKITYSSMKSIIELCESEAGCTHYDINNNRYLILCNENDNEYRQRWTKAHEIGHIICNHTSQSFYCKILDSGFVTFTNKEFEFEADYFAATLLCPFPICQELDIQSAEDIQKHFAISPTAAKNQFKKYLEWKQSHKKTAWENDLKKLYRYFNE